MDNAQTNPTLTRSRRQCRRWFWRLIRLFFADAYKRGFAAGVSIVQWRNEHIIRDLRSDYKTVEECYRANLEELREVSTRREKAEQKLKECRRYLRAANRGAERNALMAQLCLARLKLRNAPPNPQ